MKWDIKPKNGVGPLALGANMNQVGEILNKIYPIKGKIIDSNDSFTTETVDLGARSAIIVKIFYLELICVRMFRNYPRGVFGQARLSARPVLDGGGVIRQ